MAKITVITHRFSGERAILAQKIGDFFYPGILDQGQILVTHDNNGYGTHGESFVFKGEVNDTEGLLRFMNINKVVYNLLGPASVLNPLKNKM